MILTGFNRKQHYPQNIPKTSPKHPAIGKDRIDKIREDKNTTTQAEFLEFWQAYPRKTGKDKAWETWQKKIPPLQDCLKALIWQAKSDQWRKDKGQYIPHPTTWINQGRWQDCPTPSPYVHPSHLSYEREILNSELKEKKIPLQEKQLRRVETLVLLIKLRFQKWEGLS